MRSRLLAGAIAGSLGAGALNATTYLDMAVRGRPASQVPEQTLERALGGQPSDGSDDRRANRLTGIAALGGHGVGVAAGVAYAMIPGVARLPTPARALVAGGIAMVLGNAPAVLTGSTDPRTWGLSGWASDVVPHLVFGLATAAGFQALRRNGRA